MTKQEFLKRIAEKLDTLPRQEVSERLAFWDEMIDDRMEEGLSEEDAVAAVGSVDTVVTQIVADIPLVKIAKARIQRRKRLKIWETVLLWVGSPVWGSLLIAVFATLVALYASLWAVLISLWAVFGSLVGAGFGALVGGGYFAVSASVGTGVALIGAGLLCLGISFFCFYACRALSIGTIRLPKKLALGIKACFMKKEDKS